MYCFHFLLHQRNVGVLYNLISYVTLKPYFNFTGQINFLTFIWVGKLSRTPASAPANDRSNSETATLEDSSRTFMVVSLVSWFFRGKNNRKQIKKKNNIKLSVLKWVFGGWPGKLLTHFFNIIFLGNEIAVKGYIVVSALPLSSCCSIL